MKAVKLVSTPLKSKKGTPHDLIMKRRTQEQIVAVSGAIGSGLSDVVNRIEECFKRYDYDVKKVKASDLIIETIDVLKNNGTIPAGNFTQTEWTDEAQRIKELQDRGDWLRSKYGSDIISQLFIKKISADRQTCITEEEAERGEAHKEPRKVVWILDSLKHPEEVRLLRLVYDKMFSLFGVLSSYKDKKHNLVEHLGLSEDSATQLIKRDESEDINHGQKLIKTLQFGDFFIRSAPYETDRQVKSITRYVNILLGDHAVTPTHSEYAMYLAQSAAYRSGCMSRQVGAAIVNEQGGIIATGFNDVPQCGGGLYTEDSPKDARCFKAGGKCRNDLKKSNIKTGIKNFIHEAGVKLSDEQVVKLLCSTGISDLTEYCRAVHAEMDAITSAARKGVSLRNGTMFVTTYPCHNCAKHIIASGIKKVYYIEPYEKSLAIALHDDSISTVHGQSDVVEFLPFEGVAPRQYQNRFCSTAEKKTDGKFIKLDLGEETPAYAQLLDCFADYEVKIVDCLVNNGLE